MLAPKLHTAPIRVSLVALSLLLLCAAAQAEDMRTRSIRVVPTKQWTADTSATITVLPGVNTSDDEKSGEFTEMMQGWMVKSLEKLDYKTAATGGDVLYAFTVDVYDPGSAAMRFGVGFGAGNGYVRGTLTITQKGKTVGSYAYSARLRGAGTKALAKEVGPALVLQVHNGNADAELHEYDKETEKNPKTKTEI